MSSELRDRACRANEALRRVGSHIDSVGAYVQDALAELALVEDHSMEVREVAENLRGLLDTLTPVRAQVITDCRALRELGSGRAS